MSDLLAQAMLAADLAGLQALLSADPAHSNAIIAWGPNGKNRSHPLHYVCDLRFEGKVSPAASLPLVEALLAAGADVDFPHVQHGDTPLIAAASLACEDIGLRLLAAGANPAATGLFGATALHWASLLGKPGLVRALVAAGAPLNLPDQQYDSTPLGWAQHGLDSPPNGNQGGQAEVIAILQEAGAR
ncbi:MAG: hypothetical protein OHK0021_06040 [Bryobacter sp.]